MIFKKNRGQISIILELTLTILVLAGLISPIIVEVNQSKIDLAQLKLSQKVEKIKEPTLQTTKEKIAKAKEKSANAKGVYMTEFIANSRTGNGRKVRDSIVKLIEDTELNAVVIDVKEASGPNMPSSLKIFIKELQQKDIWVIARVVAFKDSSLIEEKPEWYLKTEEGGIWEDSRRGHWLDPASPEVWGYLIGFSNKVIDFGFDEIQFDYIRFPSDGDLKDINYPYYDEETQKYKIIQKFFSNITSALKEYKPEIILSADLFGQVATHLSSPGIGQRLVDVSDSFDYISFMLYPSHYYAGFSVPKDIKRNLPALYFFYDPPEQKDEEGSKEKNISLVVSNHPYEVISRSILISLDYLNSIGSESKIRPWLQDFDLRHDIELGVYYDAKRVRAQIKAAEDSGASGWLLWNPSNIYTKEALIPEF